MGSTRKQQPHSRAAVIARTVRVAMARSDINSQTELAELMGMNKASVSLRFAGTPFWTLPEIWRLDKLLQFTDDELLTITKCARK